MSPSNPSPQSSEKKRSKESKSQKRWRTPINQHDQSPYKHTELEAACTGPAWVRTMSSAHVLWLSVW